tara:strand:+ start:380 stop:1336 length:957 start_codon:yes stop_codon:yes gene_type:complete
MSKFFQSEIAAFYGERDTFQNVKFAKNSFDNSGASEAGSILEIIPVHIKNPPIIQFIAYIDALSDKFGVKYTSEQPFGRTDSYHVWQGNNRTISVNWAIPSSSKAIGLTNLNNLSWFLSSLYPAYKDIGSATSVSASPLFRFRHANLISSPTRDGQGILCVIKSVNVTHDIDHGFIGISTENVGSSFANIEADLIKAAGFQNSFHEGKKILIPKLMKLACSLEVVHDHALGWDHQTGQWRGGLAAPRYPYDFGLTRDTSDTPSAQPMSIMQDAATPADNTGTSDTPGGPADTVDPGDCILDNAPGADGQVGIDSTKCS